MTKSIEYVIHYDGLVKSYFAGWTSPAPIPRFGAKLHTTPRYATVELAQEEIRKMPITASAMCKIMVVVKRVVKRRTKRT